MSSRTNILFPIEIANRELDFRLFLAVYCARPEFRIVIGESNAIYRVLQNTQGGVYAGKNIFTRLFPGDATQLERYRVLKERGFKLVHLDEEGGVMAGEQEQWRAWLRQKLDVCCLRAEERVCTWGDWQREYYRSLNPACENNIETTGHPRFDLYKKPFRAYYDHDVQQLREKYGDFVLINTNFPWANHHKGVMGLGGAFSTRWNYNVQESQSRLKHVGHWAHVWHTTANFVKLINRMSIEMPQLNFIIRPHPSENENLYRTIFAGVKNVQVVHEGSVGPWLLASKALIHDGCTTAIEAHFCDVPVINYKSVADTRYDTMLPNQFGVQCRSEDEVLLAMNRVLEGNPEQPSAVPEIAGQLMHNFGHETFPLLANAIWQEAENVSSQGSPVDFKLRAYWKYTKLVGRDHDRRAERWEGGLAKWHALSRIGLDRKMETIQRILGKQVCYSIHSDRLMSVEG